MTQDVTDEISVWCGGKRIAKSGHRYGHFKNNVMYWVERLMLAGFCLVPHEREFFNEQSTG